MDFVELTGTFCLTKYFYQCLGFAGISGLCGSGMCIDIINVLRLNPGIFQRHLQ